MTKDDSDDSADLIIEARKSFEKCREHWADNHASATEDLRFARLEEQWPASGPGSKRQRELEGRPCETFNKMPSFIRQVVNDARLNKPQIKVHPQDDNADPRTATIINGLIRNIEVTSDADVAYDTAIECAVDRGMGYYRINTRYTSEDTFDQDIVFERVSNPLTVYGDPNSQAADSSDWNEAWVLTTMTEEEFEAEYPDAKLTDWDCDLKGCPDGLGRDGDNITVAEWWTRDKVKSQIVAMSDGSVVNIDDLKAHAADFDAYGITPVGEPREVESYKVTQRILNGAEVLKEVAWAGKYIPIVPVYGDEVIDETGKRHYLSLIRPAKGAQRMYNYMRNTGIELLALQPKVPFIGPKGAFDSDPNWDKVNDQSVAYLEYDGSTRPDRQPPPQGSQAVLQEALTASDDMKAIIGIYDASLGARSNETSGIAINARQREGDVSTFHFIDNLQRAIRHGGRILLDLIPKVYSTQRIIRVLGEDMAPTNAQIAPTGQPVQQQQGPDGSIMHVYDITAGKYDLTVSSGPSFTSRREEVQQMMSEFMQAAPQVAPILLPYIAKMMDFPQAEEISTKLEAMDPTSQQSQQMQQQMQQVQQQAGQAVQQVQQQAGQMQQQAGQQLQQMQQQIAQLTMALKDKSHEAQLKEFELQLKAKDLQIKEFQAHVSAMKPTHAPSISQAA